MGLRGFSLILSELHLDVRSPRTRRFSQAIGVRGHHGSGEKIISRCIRESGKFAGLKVEGIRLRQWARACQFMGSLFCAAVRRAVRSCAPAFFCIYGGGCAVAKEWGEIIILEVWYWFCVPRILWSGNIIGLARGLSRMSAPGGLIADHR